MPRATKPTITTETASTSDAHAPETPAAGVAKATAPAPKKAVAKAPAKAAAKRPAKPPVRENHPDFLASQRALLLQERETYVRQADELKAQADSLALEHEPGDVQFDEEGGEGGTSNVDRELDLVLSGQARAAIEEIDRALAKMDAGAYGRCEQCGQDIPEARLEALPHASMCVACKSGGLSSRR